MKKLILALLLLFAVRVNAQTRILLGATGGAGFSSSYFGPSAALEIPVKKLEIDLSDEYFPLYNHTSIGSGEANRVKAGGILWLGHGVGLTGSAEYSKYVIAEVRKGQYYGFGGLIFRKKILDSPTRISLTFIDEFNNGVSSTGLESSHLKGGDIGLSVRIGCAGSTCFRLGTDNFFGRVLEQGNPKCDGSIGTQTCGSRISAMGGGFSISFQVEFPRRKGHEDEVF